MNYSPRPSNILLIEPHAQGHHGPYVQWMIEGLAERNYKVTLMTLSESLQHPSLRHISTNLAEIIQPAHFQSVSDMQENQSSFLGLLRREFAYWHMFRVWYQYYKEQRFQPDAVLLPYLDYCLYATSLLGTPFGKTPWVGVAMRPSFHYQQMGIIAPKPICSGLEQFLFGHLLTAPHLKCLFTIDESLFEYFQNRKGAGEKVQFLPEPADLVTLPDPSKAKRELGMPPERKLILVYGAITLRKGVAELLTAIAGSECPRTVDVVLAGKVSPEVRKLLAKPWMQRLGAEHRLRVFDRYISSQEERLLFAGCDMVWLGYRNHFTCSGVLVQAAQAGRPVISCEVGVLGWQVRRHNLGVTVCPTDIASVVTGIKKLEADCEVWNICSLNGKRDFAANTIEKSKDFLVKAFES